MPLSVSDIQFLNKQLDIHQNLQRAWFVARYVHVALAVILIAGGLWIGASAVTFGRSLAQAPEPRRLTTIPADATSTQPVTRAELNQVIQLATSHADIEARMQNIWNDVFIAWSLFSLGLLAMGCLVLFLNIGRWNHFRRNLLLVTLIREKCAAELAISHQPAPNP